MCVIAIKHLPEFGWVAGKNRDRAYRPKINIKQSFRRGVERCLLWDEDTKWSEGVNEHGVAILNTTMKVVKDEKEGDKSKKPSGTFYSPSGKAIRTALYEKTVKKALQSLIDNKTEGFAVVFSESEAYLLEAPTFVDKPDAPYSYKTIKLDKSKTYVRTNHGVLFPDAGYPVESDDEKLSASRKSSESRYEITHRVMNKVKEPLDILRALSQHKEKNLQMNPLRTTTRHGKSVMVTTGQLLIVPKDNTLHYRPLWCDLDFNFAKLDSDSTNTYFEVISSRHLLTTLESVGGFSTFCKF